MGFEHCCEVPADEVKVNKVVHDTCPIVPQQFSH